MARVRLTYGALDDLGNAADQLHPPELAKTEARRAEIISALDVLAHNPLIGRPDGEGRRELVIGGELQGHVALYRYVSMIDTALVLALRTQHEAGCPNP